MKTELAISTAAQNQKRTSFQPYLPISILSVSSAP